MIRILLVEPDLEDNGALRVSLDRATRWVEMGATVDLSFVSAFAGKRTIAGSAVAERNLARSAPIVTIWRRRTFLFDPDRGRLDPPDGRHFRHPSPHPRVPANSDAGD